MNLIPPETESILDVGIEKGALAALSRLYHHPKRIVGIDFWQPYLDYADKQGYYDELKQIDLETELLPFRDREFDVALAVEVIEHLTKPAALRLIQELKRVALQVIATTPNGYKTQHAIEENPYQIHRSGWTIQELRSLGFKPRLGGNYTLFGRFETGMPSVISIPSGICKSSTIIGVWESKGSESPLPHY